SGTPGESQINAGDQKDKKDKKISDSATPQEKQAIESRKDRDVNVGTSGTFSVPRVQMTAKKMNLPKSKQKKIVNLDFLLAYKPEQSDISNKRASHAQFTAWVTAVQEAYDVSDEQLQILMDGLMVWCIENGTSHKLTGNWTMMDGADQVEYPLEPVIANAKPTLRQIMAHFSDLAEAYIKMRNSDRSYMPRYGLQRNLTDMSLSQYAFDFYEVTSRTPIRAREALTQMKAAAVGNTTNRMFGLDGNLTNTEEDTERHTAQDVNRHMHTLLGVRQ
nr:coat protein [Spiranthes mosaic virus 3]